MVVPVQVAGSRSCGDSPVKSHEQAVRKGVIESIVGRRLVVFSSIRAAGDAQDSESGKTRLLRERNRRGMFVLAALLCGTLDTMAQEEVRTVANSEAQESRVPMTHQTRVVLSGDFEGQ